ncbi:tumor necrosis factor alpha-induced protein 2-like [Mugil cephalus]|uniref:tumor necrosis factor alpha-induced protein 2-like n=1 Tax=Mugil cephalus TaxID=48193 RepID=UPI001FB74E02|nr:tumor necrosis factor alpha-induced protein 2-like [Mugil cephalus]
MSEMMGRSKDDTGKDKVSVQNTNGLIKPWKLLKKAVRGKAQKPNKLEVSHPPLEEEEEEQTGRKADSDETLSSRVKRSVSVVQNNLRSPTSFFSGKRPSLADGKQPPVVISTFKHHLDKKQWCEASQLLINKEKNLFGNITEEEDLSYDKEEEQKLAADYEALEKLVMETVVETLSISLQEVDDINESVSAHASALTSAVKVIMQEEEQDQMWKTSCQTVPSWRPCNWRKTHDSKLQDLVEERMNSSQTPTANQAEQSSIQTDVQNMGRQLKEDLLLVVKLVKSCYPPEMDICNFYAKLYHQVFSTRLRTIAESRLDDKDCTFLLRYVNECYPSIFQDPELASEINVESLGKLLPQELLVPLEKQYLDNQEAELKTLMERIVDNAVEEWKKGEEPKREDGCYVSHVAYDIIQFINDMVKAAKVIVGDLHKAQEITRPVSDSMQRYKVFQEDIIKQNKPNSTVFIKANLSWIKDFRYVLDKKSHLFQEEVQRSCLDVITNMKQSAHMYLLSPVHKNLKTQYQKLGTKDWLNNNEFDKLLLSIEKELQELQGPNQSCYQELIGQLHQEVTEEYVRRLLKGKVKLKDKEQQQDAYDTLIDDAESLHNLFKKMGSQNDWLKEILTKIAEVLRLQDIPAIQMEIAELRTAHPDHSEEHIAALLKLKNLKNQDRENITETALETMEEIPVNPDARNFFSRVPLKSEDQATCFCYKIF